MSHKKEIITAVGTLAIAVGIGFVMQRSEAAQERYGKEARASVAVNSSSVAGAGFLGAMRTDELIEVQAIELTSASDVAPVTPPQSETAVQRVAASPADVLAPPPAEDTAPQIAQCEMTASAEAVPGGMAMLHLDAPCAPNERLTVHHNGLIFTQATDDAGTLKVLVPALAKDGVFIMAFSNGDGAVAQVSVPDIDAFSRVALQWRGQAGFQLHAREFGASYGDAGHVWSGGEAAATGFLNGETGALMRLGDPELADPLVAEVYTFAAGRSGRDGLIDLSVETEITMQNCGLEVEAQTLEMSDRGTITTRDLTLAVPGCDAAGDFLVLNNLVTDMKVASN
ncbi:hypothetical protein [uncultured Tateyamaria sp.]|uniref:hypothetical protein n=1 Tax=Tateyamaria sp. 1078 TaxID=3417464 RepID=UPI002609D13A|nr:hypothetical protein [uncultured Tateyamaria sp.]